MRPTSDAYHTSVTAVASMKRCHQIQFRHVRRWSQTTQYATYKRKTAMIETGWCVKKAPCPPRVQSCHARPEVLKFGGGFFYALLHCRHLANIALMGGRGRAFFTHQPVSRYRGVASSICTANDQLCQSGHYSGDRISCHTTNHVSGCDMLVAESGR